MAYTLTEEPGFVRFALHGIVTPQEVLAAVAVFETLEASRTPVPHRLIDLSRVDFSEVRGDAIREIAERRKAQRFPNRFRAALLAVTPAQYGYARMFQIRNEHPDITLQVFSEEAAAVAWLRKTPSDRTAIPDKLPS